MTGRRTGLTALCVFVLAALLYLPTLRNGFVWDDTALIENHDIRTLDAAALKRIFTTNFWEATEAHSGLYRPLTALSFHTDCQIYGLAPSGYHLTNVLLNAAVCALAWYAVTQLPLPVGARVWLGMSPLLLLAVAVIALGQLQMLIALRPEPELRIASHGHYLYVSRGRRLVGWVAAPPKLVARVSALPVATLRS